MRTTVIRTMALFQMFAVLIPLTLWAGPVPERKPIYPEDGKGMERVTQALADAQRDHKRVLLMTGGNWCGWCRRLDAFLSEPEMAAILEKDFVLAKLDQDRMPGAKEVIAKLRTESEGGGIPWFAFLDAAGKTRITSTAPAGGNIGFPQEATTEIPYFKTMLETVRTNMTPEDIQRVVDRLTEVRVQRESGGK